MGSLPEVLLFYDGFELRAEATLKGQLKEALRRRARFTYRWLKRSQTSTGFHTWFLMLCRALEHAGCRVRVNDFKAAERAPDRPIGLLGYPSVLEKVDGLSNPRLIGPGISGTPNEEPDLLEDPRSIFFLQTCAWGEALYRPWYGDRQRLWFGGYDVSDFVDSQRAEKKWDVLIYDKIYFDRECFYPRTIERFRNMLDQKGLRHTTVRYGQYLREDYLRTVRASRSMAFFAHSETQGMAYQECLASGVPIYAWDEGTWPHPVAKLLSADPIACTSVPYFDENCGRRFTIAAMLDDWSNFYEALGSYDPRRFIAEEMTLEKSAAAYLKAYDEVGHIAMASGEARLQHARCDVSTPC